jgi:Cu(I)/Ag(I) efflux system membrane fusion protein
MVVLIGVASVVITGILGFLMRHHATTAIEAIAPASKQASYWYDPMHPDQHFDRPGKSPFMDMQLIPKYRDQTSAGGGSDGGRGSILIDPRIVQTLGIRLATVERSRFARVVDTVGLVAVDEHRIEAIQVREPGWVERLEIRATGDSVHRGQLLASIYSPDLLATQQELLIARSSNDRQLIEAARHRLELFGLSAAQIARIEKTGKVERRIEYFAPFDGYVMELGSRQGAAVEPGNTLFQLANLSTVWLIAEVPEVQATWIKAGDTAQAEVPALPGERFDGKVDYLYPELIEASRTLKVRVAIKNPGQLLRPGMFATVHLQGRQQESALTIPTEAVIKTGSRSIVIIADDATHFRPLPVQIGAEHNGRSEVLSGLDVGQSVVASGQFLLDSESNLRAAFDNLAGSDGSTGSTTDANQTLMPVSVPMPVPIPAAPPPEGAR